MSLTYGFYNSLNHDRVYNAIQMSSIFDGIISDGIFMSIGDRLVVTAVGTDMFVAVGTGRAWFNHTWTLNDASLPLEIPQSELTLNRYDAVVLEVNAEQSVRANSIKVVKGTPASTPSYPALINTVTVHQYPLAYIYVKANATSIRQADITSMVGKSSAPYVTGIIDTIDIEDMVAQWEDQWKKFFEEENKDMSQTNAAWKEQWRTWFASYVKEMDESAKQWDDLWHEWYHMYTDSSSEEFANWKTQQKADFLVWFNGLKDTLSGQVESMMAAEIEELKKRADVLEKFRNDLAHDQSIYGALKDSDEDIITNNLGEPIEGDIKFALYDEEDICDHPIAFDSDDRLDPDEYDLVPLVTSGSNLRTLMNQFSRTVKNVRYLVKRTFDNYWEMLGFYDPPVEIRRNTFRGKNLGTELTQEQAQNIVNGTFRGFYIGDYWVDGDIIWRIVDINYWIHRGDVPNGECKEPHLVIMPDYELYRQRMNATTGVTGGYVGSEMYRTGLNEAKSIVNRFFGENNVLKHREYLVNGVATNGYATSISWMDSTVEIPNEIMIYGSYVFTPGTNGTNVPQRQTADFAQLALMQIHPKWINPHRVSYWLRDLVTVNNFAAAFEASDPGHIAATTSSFGVRPVFGITGKGLAG